MLNQNFTKTLSNLLTVDDQALQKVVASINLLKPILDTSEFYKLLRLCNQSFSTDEKTETTKEDLVKELGELISTSNLPISVVIVLLYVFEPTLDNVELKNLMDIYTDKDKQPACVSSANPDYVTCFKNARVGDQVYHLMGGYGTIIEIDNEDPHTPIYAVFRNRDSTWFTIDGRYAENCIEPLLFWDKPTITHPPEPVRGRTVNGVSIPDISFKPKNCDNYYYPDPNKPEKYGKTLFSFGEEIDMFRSDQGMCYPSTVEGLQAAIAHAEAWLSC